MRRDDTVVARLDRSLERRLGERTGWLLAAVGAVLVVVGSLLPWTYTAAYPQNLTVYLYPAGPQLYVLVLAVVALFVLIGPQVPGVSRVARAVVPHGGGGTARVAGLGTVVITTTAILGIMLELGGAVNVDPGGWIALGGGLVLAAGARVLSADAPTPTRRELPDWLEIAIVAVALGAILYAIVVGLALNQTESFLSFAIFVGFFVAVLIKSGVLAWITDVARRHYGITVVAAFLVAFLFPFTQGDNNRFLNVGANILIFAVVAMGLNIVIGLAGLLDLGYVAFLGVGAYVGALFSGSNFSAIGWVPPFPVVLLFGAMAAALLGVVIGIPSIRTRGDYLAIVTLGFGEIFRISANNLNGSNGPDLTNGPNGIPGVPHLNFFGWDLGSSTTIFGVELGYFANYYFLELLLLAFVIVVFVRSNNSRIGRAWVAIREDETAAAAMGINTFRLKVMAFVLGASLAGFAGVFQSHLTTSVDPTQYPFLESAFLVAAIVLGGMGTVAGVLVGATVLELLPEKLRFLDNSRLFIFGLALVVMMRFRPEGLVPNKRRAAEFHEDEDGPAGRVAPIASTAKGTR